jgi:hypothetical protein
MKPWYTSKTVWVNVLTLTALIIGTLVAHPALETMATPLAIALSVVNVVLRFLTTKPVR